MERFKKVLKIIGIIIIIVAVLGVACGLLFVKFNQDQIAILTEESNKIADMNLIEDDIDMQIKTKGKYAIVETSMKEYMNDIKTLCNNIITLCDESSIDQILSSDNIKNDGPDFVQTKANITEFKTQINTYLEETQKILNEDNILNKINEKNLPNEYKELYKKLMIDQNSSNLSDAQSELETTIETLNTTLDTITSILDFLSKNSSYWEIKDGKIQFSNVKKLTEYYQLLNKVSTN